MSKYIVTGYVKSKKRRDMITEPATKKKAEASKKKIEDELKIALPKYKWVKALKVEEK